MALYRLYSPIVFRSLSWSYFYYFRRLKLKPDVVVVVVHIYNPGTWKVDKIAKNEASKILPQK